MKLALLLIVFVLAGCKATPHISINLATEIDDVEVVAKVEL